MASKEEIEEKLNLITYEREKIDFSLWFKRSEAFNISAAIILKSINDDFEKNSPADGVLVHATAIHTNAPIYERYVVYIFLKGLAFELLFKGGYVRNIEKFNEKLLKTHNLFELLKLNDLTLATPDKLIIKRLSKYIVWAGKYPFPMTAREFKKDGKAFWDRLWFQITEGHIADRLEVIFKDIYKQICEKPTYLEKLHPATPQPRKRK